MSYVFMSPMTPAKQHKDKLPEGVSRYCLYWQQFVANIEKVELNALEVGDE